MRVVSLVPSWTETLIEAGVEVIGRTRFCIHPRDRVGAIPRVGGTKDWDWSRIQALKPDLLVLDREENPKFMAEPSEIPVCASHITGVTAMPGALNELALRLNNSRLKQMAQEWSDLLWRRRMHSLDLDPEVLRLPGVLEWGLRPQNEITKIVYVIWKDPWMRVGRETFIGSVLDSFGYAIKLDPGPEKYPKFELSDYDPKTTLLVFSSEPFPFLRHKVEVHRLGFPHVFVDGENYSWFGVRSYAFLTKA